MTVSLYFFLVLAAVYNGANSSPFQRDVSIMGGDIVDITEYPYQVLVLNKGYLWCGGSIISDEYILTAAHCLIEVMTENFSVKIGTSYVDKGGEELKVKKKFIHPKYDGHVDYDFGVLQMAEKIPINNETTRIVQIADSGSSLNPGDNIVVTGWGYIEEDGPLSNELRAVTVPVVSKKSCQKAFDTIEVITERMLCAGLPEGGKDACGGDSGGPAVSVDDLVQYGIVSFGVGCARGEYPGVYSYIPAERDWIREVSGV